MFITTPEEWILRALSPMRMSGIEQDSHWAFRAPGSVHDTLCENGIISDPYDGDEAERTMWIAQSCWAAECMFEASKGSICLLSIPDISPSEIRVNGAVVAEIGARGSVYAEISDRIVDGSNELSIIFSPLQDPEIGDDGFFPGIWSRIRILSSDDALFHSPRITTREEDGSWMVDIRLSVCAAGDARLPFKASVNGIESCGTLSVSKDIPSCRITIPAGDAAAWWPAGAGPQPLYPLQLSIGDWDLSRDIAFRSIEMLKEGLFVNGRRFYMKGSIFKGTDLIPSRTGASGLEKIVRGAAEANMNTLLLAVPPTEDLEDAALRYGLVLIEEASWLSPGSFSAPSFPSKAMMDRIWKDGEKNISSRMADLHGGASARILSLVADSFLFPEGMEKLSYLSQAKAAMDAIECAARQRLKSSVGMILSRLADSWPAISDSAMEHGGKWKLLHYATRSFFSPLAPVIVADEHAVSIYFVNDTSEPQKAEFSLKIRDFSGSKRETREYAAVAEPGSMKKVAEYPLFRVDRRRMFIYVKMSTKDILRERSVLLDEPKSLFLEDPVLKTSVQQTGPRQFAVKLTAEKPAFLVALDSSVPGIFSDNIISVRPSAEKTVFFRAEEESSLDAFASSLKVMDLYSAMH